jgi:RNA polymerase sigma factor (sigma-70 family)
MGAKIGGAELLELLTQGAWARRLARRLMRGDDEADDLLQEAWMSAAKGPGPSRATPRTWLAGVMHILARRHARAAGRRRQREGEAAADVAAQDDGVLADDLLARVETQRQLAETLLALDEPYRKTVLLRYYEGLSAAEIARRTEVPAGTVRWRLKEGLARLRRDVDERAGGRRACAVALARFVGRGAVTTGGRRIVSGVAMAAATVGAVGLAVLSGLRVVPSSGPPDEVATGAGNGGRTAEQPDRRFQRAVGALSLAAGPGPLAGPISMATPARQLPPSKVPRFWVPLGVGPVKGPASAKVTILAFMDYQSPFCLAATRTMDEVLEAHAGEVRYQVLHRPLPIHPRAAFAARAALAASQQGKFWEMHRTLLTNQNALEPDDIDRYAARIGLDVARFEADLGGPTVLGQFDVEEANARSVKVGGIPTLFFNGRGVAGSRSRDEYDRVLAEEIAYADAVLKTGVAPGDLYNTITRSGASEVTPGLAFDRSPAPSTFDAAWKLIDGKTAAVNDCYRAEQVKTPALTGGVVLEVTLVPDQPPAFLIRESTIDAPGLGDCIVNAMRVLTFPRAKGDKKILLRRRFNFPPEVGRDSAGSVIPRFKEAP